MPHDPRVHQLVSLLGNHELTVKEMMTLIDYALQHDMSENAEKAYNIILNGNTFESRVKQMIELLDRK